MVPVLKKVKIDGKDYRVLVELVKYFDTYTEINKHLWYQNNDKKAETIIGGEIVLLSTLDYRVRNNVNEIDNLPCQALKWSIANKKFDCYCNNLARENTIYCRAHKDFSSWAARTFMELDEIINTKERYCISIIDRRNQIILAGNEKLIPLMKIVSMNGKDYRIIENFMVSS